MKPTFFFALGALFLNLACSGGEEGPGSDSDGSDASDGGNEGIGGSESSTGGAPSIDPIASCSLIASFDETITASCSEFEGPDAATLAEEACGNIETIFVPGLELTEPCSREGGTSLCVFEPEDDNIRRVVDHETTDAFIEWRGETCVEDGGTWTRL